MSKDKGNSNFSVYDLFKWMTVGRKKLQNWPHLMSVVKVCLSETPSSLCWYPDTWLSPKLSLNGCLSCCTCDISYLRAHDPAVSPWGPERSPWGWRCMSGDRLGRSSGWAALGNRSGGGVEELSREMKERWRHLAVSSTAICHTQIISPFQRNTTGVFTLQLLVRVSLH